MNPFVPPEHLVFDEAIDRVVEIKRGDAGPLLTAEQTAKLRDFRAIFQPSKPKLTPVRPVPKVGYGSTFSPSKTINQVPNAPAKETPARHNLTKEEWQDLLSREAQHKEQRCAAREKLQQVLWTGRLPAIVIDKNGVPRAIPNHLWGGNQWHELFRTGQIQWYERDLMDFVSGRPLILRDALEEVFNPNGHSEEEPEQNRTRGRRARGQEAARLAFAALYPNGLPQDPWKTITAQVNDWLVKNQMSQISDDTVRRAAKRR